MPNPRLPSNVKEALDVCSALAERVVGIKAPQLHTDELLDLSVALDVLYDRLDPGAEVDLSAATLREVTKDGRMKVALVQLVAFACRKPLSGSGAPHEDRLHAVAHMSPVVIGHILRAPAAEASPAAKATLAAVAGAVLKGQNLHAAAGQVATAAEVLSSPEQQAGLSADSLARVRLKAAEMTGRNQYLVGSLAVYADQQQDSALAEALLADLRGSRLLEHTGRLLMLLAPGHGEAPAPAALSVEQARDYVSLSNTLRRLHPLLTLAGRLHGLELQPCLGVCGLHALLALGASTLAAADGGPCVLPWDPLLAPATDADALECITGAGMESLMFALLADRDSPQPSLTPRARLRLVVRLLRLAGASACALREVVVCTQEGRLRVALSWGGGRRRRSQEYGLLLPPESIGQVACFAVGQLTLASAVAGRAWAAEAGSLLPSLFTASRCCLEALPADTDAEVVVTVAGAVASLLTSVPRPQLHGERYAMVLDARDLPAAAAAALEAGVVSLLETLLRAAGDDPAGPEAHMLDVTLKAPEASRRLVALLVHGPPRQAAAFLATLAKLLRRTPPEALLEEVGRQGEGRLPRGAWLALTCCILRHLIPASKMDTEPAGPVDPAGLCSPFFVLTLAALQLLPVLSRLVREAAQLPQAPEARCPPGASNCAPMPTVISNLLHILEWALTRAGVFEGGDEEPKTRVTAALCLPFLVEQAGAVQLVGALLDALLRDGELPGERPTSRRYLACMALCCEGLAEAYPERVRGLGGSNSSGAGGSPGACASAAWSPAALRLLASKLARSGRHLAEGLEDLATRLEQPLTAGAPPESNPAAAELAAEAERFAALRAEVRAVLPPACSNPACVSLAGDSEAGLRLQQCSRCGRASYCCRECQVAHWKAGHKEACGGAGGAGGSKTG